MIEEEGKQELLVIEIISSFSINQYAEKIVNTQIFFSSYTISMKKDFPLRQQNPISLNEKWGLNNQSMAPSVKGSHDLDMHHVSYGIVFTIKQD